jgi:predicted transcriptional regulator
MKNVLMNKEPYLFLKSLDSGMNKFTDFVKLISPMTIRHYIMYFESSGLIKRKKQGNKKIISFTSKGRNVLTYLSRIDELSTTKVK